MADKLVGRVFNGKYRITRLIARGGMGKVYLATQEPLGRRVALKVLNPAYTAEQSADFHKRFFFEASTAALLTHPNSVTLFDYGCADGATNAGPATGDTIYSDNIYYMAMEYLEGDSLRHALSRARYFTPARAVRIAMQVCRALREAHGMGVIHRDLKPANIFLLHHGDEHDFVKVLDFGLVKRIVDRDESLTQTGLFLGSPGYMPPEQIRGEPVDARCDVYALGAVLYEMLAGQPPFARTNGLETMAAHVHERVPTFAEARASQEIPQNLEQVVLTALRKQPSERFASMEAFLKQLKRVDASLRLAEPIASRLPEEIEESGWTVVTSTGILGRPRSPFDVDPDAPTQGINAEDMAATMAMNAADDADTDPDPVPELPRTEAIALPGDPAPTVIQAYDPSRVARRRGVTARIRRDVPHVSKLAALATSGADWMTHHWARPMGLIMALSSCWHVPPADCAKPAPPAESRDLVLNLTSNPEGAAVYEGDSLVCDATPCTLNLPDQPRNVPLVLRFVMSGHEELTLGRVARGDHITLHANLAAMGESI